MINEEIDAICNKLLDIYYELEDNDVALLLLIQIRELQALIYRQFK
jgi:hypothetical protein